MQIFLVFALFIAILAVIFAIQNNAPATVSFAVWEFQGSLALMLMVSLIAGVLISIFVSLPANLKARWTIRQQRKKMAELEHNLTDLRLQLDTLQAKLNQLQLAGESPASVPLPEPPAPPALPLEEPQEELPGGEEHASE